MVQLLEKITQHKETWSQWSIKPLCMSWTQHMKGKKNNYHCFKSQVKIHKRVWMRNVIPNQKIFCHWREQTSHPSKQVLKIKSKSQGWFFTSPAFIRALIALALISSSRSSSCCADGWTSADGGTAKAAALGSFGLDSANPSISFTLFSMSFWRSSIWPAPLLTVFSCTSGPSSLHGPSMSLSYASAFMLRTSLSSPLPAKQM